MQGAAQKNEETGFDSKNAKGFKNIIAYYIGHG